MIPTDRTIVEICFPLFNLIHDLNKKNYVPDSQLLHSKVIHEFLNIEESLRNSGVLDAVFMDIKFVMSAFIDEMILKRGDDCAIAWSKDSLQTQFFKENLGGEKFFERLSYFQKFSDRRFDILELYYWCLELGYEGKYCKDNADDLKVIKENLRAIIKSSQMGDYMALNFQGIENSKNILETSFVKNPIKAIFLGILLSSAVVYGMQILLVKYFLNGLKLLSTNLV